jgi:hypothetical protein
LGKFNFKKKLGYDNLLIVSIVMLEKEGLVSHFNELMPMMEG